MKKPNADPVVTTTKLIVRVLQDLVAGDEQFANYADLAEALKCRCARLHIPYDSGLIADAMDRLECGGKAPLIRPPAPPPPAPAPAPVVIDRQTAAQIARALLDRYHAEHDATPHPLRDVAPVRQLSAAEIQRRQFAADKRRALQMVLDEINAAAARADALEATLPKDGDA